MFHLKDISRKQAFLSHLGLSIIIFLVVLYFIVFHWYPQPFFTTDGGWQGVRLIAAVDIILGPLLTLIIFNPTKKELKMDVSIIAFIQIAALVSGLYVVHNERPVAKIFRDGTFHMVTAYDMTERDIAVSDLEKYRIGGAVTIYLDLPDEYEPFSKLLLKSVRKREPIFLNSSLYKKFDAQAVAKMRLFSIDIERYVKDEYGKEGQTILKSFLNKHNAKADDYLYIGIHSRYKFAITAINPKTLEFIGIIPGIQKPDIQLLNKYIEFDLYRTESLKKSLRKEIELEKKNKDKTK